MSSKSLFLKTHEITKTNFEWKYKEIETSLRKAQFISFDVECTGSSRKNFIRKMDGMNDFETPERIYANLKLDVKNCIIIQFGVTSFNFDTKANKYEAISYVFYVFPRSVPSLQQTFGFQAAVMELLSLLDFDFNKVVYEGISSLNGPEEEQFRQDLFTNSILGQTKRPLSMKDERIIHEQCSTVSKWECNAKVGDKIELEGLDYSKKLVVYLLIKKIQARFPTLWTYKIENDLDPSSPGIIVEKVSDLKRGELQSQSIKLEIYEKELMKHYVGVSRIFKLLVQMKKPIIGSGALFDLMLMYQQFHKPLPAIYAHFKCELNSLFPHIYDSKHVTYEVRELCRRKGVVLDKENGLEILDRYFEHGWGASLPPGNPAIYLSDYTCDAPANIGQDAGWNSYYTGCCFIRMAHFLAKENKYGCGSEVQPQMTIPALFSVGVKQFKNFLHISPATVDYIHLDLPDPVAEKPRSLVLTSMLPLPKGPVAVFKDFVETVRGSLQVKMLKIGGHRRPCVTVNSLRAAQEIARRCNEGRDYTFRDNTNSAANAVKLSIFTGGAVGFASLLVWKMYKLLT